MPKAKPKKYLPYSLTAPDLGRSCACPQRGTRRLRPATWPRRRAPPGQLWTAPGAGEPASSLGSDSEILRVLLVLACRSKKDHRLEVTCPPSKRRPWLLETLGQLPLSCASAAASYSGLNLDGWKLSLTDNRFSQAAMNGASVATIWLALKSSLAFLRAEKRPLGHKIWSRATPNSMSFSALSCCPTLGRAFCASSLRPVSSTCRSCRSCMLEGPKL